MGAFIQNPRRSPRVPLRLPAEVTQHGASWLGEIEDFGPGGCLVRSPRVLAQGAGLRLVLRCEEAGDALSVAAQVAWLKEDRSGVAFVPRRAMACEDPKGFFDRIVAARPRLAANIERAPERIALDSPLYFLPAPRAILDLEPDELSLLALGRNGIGVESLLASAHLGDERSLRALFGLFEKGVFTLALGKASDPWKWRALLNELRPSPASPPARTAEPVPPLAGPPPGAANVALRSHAALLRGVAPAQRSTAAQARFEQARAAANRGQIHEALALLRQALALAPRDPEISRTLGLVAFQSR